MTSGLSVREAAEKTGLTGHTLRYYERIGLIWEVARDGVGHRRYASHQIDWLLLLTRLRATGLPIAGMVRYAELVRSGGGERARLDLLRAHRVQVRAKLAELSADLTLIDHKIQTYERRVCAEAAPTRLEESACSTPPPQAGPARPLPRLSSARRCGRDG